LCPPVCCVIFHMFQHMKSRWELVHWSPCYIQALKHWEIPSVLIYILWRSSHLRYPLSTSPFPLVPDPCYISGLKPSVEIPVSATFQLLWKNYLRTFINRERFILSHGFRVFTPRSLGPVAFGSVAKLYIMMTNICRRNRLTKGQHPNFFYKVTLSKTQSSM
jgi:hypothetical protein